ncbi:MAG: CBS domain-containing protein [Anaerobiospirillum succiniciproducens]|nr:CBS domain-containing protein [Anaerobiospirillum succiniciproducens]
MGSESEIPQHMSFLSRTRERLMRAVLKRGLPSNQSELAKVIEQASQDDIINEETEDMIRGVFDITQRRVADVMIPRSQIRDIDSECTIGEAIKIVIKYGHSRYPVSFEDKDHIQGILMAKDLLPMADQCDKKISDFPNLLRKPVIVPESKHVNRMLKDFQKNRFHMAIVVDEYGGVCGLITIEDIIELIVGEINDEYETEVEGTNITKSGDNTYIVAGCTPVEEFEEYFKTTFPDISVDTVAGLALHYLGHIPQKDEQVSFNEFTFKVLDTKLHQINNLQVTVAAKEDE